MNYALGVPDRLRYATELPDVYQHLNSVFLQVQQVFSLFYDQFNQNQRSCNSLQVRTAKKNVGFFGEQNF